MVCGANHESFTNTTVTSEKKGGIYNFPFKQRILEFCFISEKICIDYNQLRKTMQMFSSDSKCKLHPTDKYSSSSD